MIRKWTIGILLAVLLIVAASIGFAEDTMIINIPDEIPFGEELPYSIQFSRNEGELWIFTENPDGSSSGHSMDISEHINETTGLLEGTIDFSYQIEYEGLEPGEELLTFEWKIDGKYVGLCEKTVLLTGEKLERPTLAVRNASGTETITFRTGDSVTVGGSTGSADQVCVRMSRNMVNGRSYHTLETLTPDAQGEWSCVIPAEELEGTNSFAFEAEGYLDGIYIGTSEEVIITMHENPDTVSVPTVECTPDASGLNVTIKIFNPDPEQYDSAYYRVFDNTGREVFSDGEAFNESGIVSMRGTFNYSEEHTVQAFAYSETGSGYIFSRPAYGTFTLTGREPRPIYGKLPLPEIPDTLLEGEPLIIEWAPAAEGQFLSLYIYDDEENRIRDEYTSSAETFEIADLSEGIYKVELYTEADYYKRTKKEALLRVLENPDLPAAPTLTLLDENVYNTVPFRVKLDQEYDDVQCRLIAELEDYDTWIGIETVLDGDTIRIRNYDYTWEEIEQSEKVTLYVKAKKNGFWSAETSLQITFTAAPEVDEITFIDFPETVQRGEEMTFTALMPGNSGEVTIELMYPDLRNSYSWTTRELYGNILTYTVSGNTTASQYLDEDIYYIRLTWNGQEAVRQFRLVGEIPVKPAIDPIPTNLQAGGSVTLTGRVGGADRIEVDFYWENNEHYDDISAPVTIRPDGTWSCTLTNLKAGKYSVDIDGYKGNLSTGGLYTLFFVADQNSLPKPTVTKVIDGNRITLTMKPGVNVSGKEVMWYYSRSDLYGGSYYNVYDADADGGHVYSTSVNDYTNTYTYSIAYKVDGVFSAPEQVIWEVTGRPYPVNGKIPLNLNIPEIWEAGTDQVIQWTPVAVGQRLYYNINDSETGEWFGSNEFYASSVAETTFTIDGSLLEEGNYRLYVDTEADTYEDAYKNYYFTVVDNRPEGPEVTLSADHGKVGETVMATVNVPTPGILVVKRSGWSQEQYRVQSGSVQIAIPLEDMGETICRFSLKTSAGSTKSTVKKITVELGKKVPSVNYDTLVTWPSKISAGEDATFTLKDISGIDYYYVNVYGGEISYSRDFQSEDTKFTIPGAFFKKGEKIQVQVRAYVNGMNDSIGGYESAATKSYTVASGSSTADSITISAADTTAYMNSSVPVTLSKTAKEIILVKKGPRDSNWYTNSWWYNGNWKNIDVNFWEQGTNQIKIIAKIDGKWTKWSNALSFTVKQPKGSLKYPEATAVQSGNNLHVTWNAVSHATTYYVSGRMNSGRWFWREITNGATECDFPVSELGEGTGYVYVVPEASGYDTDYNSQIRTLFTLKATETPTEAFNLPAAMTVVEAEAFMGIQAETIVVSPSCTEIRSKAFAGNTALKVIWIPNKNTIVAEDAFEGCGEIVIRTPEGSKAEEALSGQENITFEHIP